MRFSTTIALAVIAVLLGISISVVNREPDFDDAAAANVLTRFEAEAVDRLVIERGPSKSVLVKRGDSWFFSEPEQDRADAKVIAKLLDEFNHLSIIDELNDEGGDALTPTQLGIEGDQAIRVSVSGKPEKGDKIDSTFVLGTAAPRQNAIYAERGGKVFVVDGNPREWIEQPLATLRDRRLISAPVEAIVQLGIKKSTGSLALQRKLTPPQQNWALIDPVQVWASPERVEELLAELAGLSIQQVVSGSGGETKIPNPLPENAAVIQLGIFGYDKPLTVYLQQFEAPPVEGAPAIVEARVSDRPGVYRFPSLILSKLPKDPGEIRDRTLARIPEQFLESVFIQSRIDPDVILRSKPATEGMHWDVVFNDQLVPANQAKVSELVAGINEAAIQTFVSDDGGNLADYGLQPPARKVTFNIKIPAQPGPDGTSIQPQSITRVLNLGWQQGQEQRLFANWEGEPHIYELDPTFVNLIATHPVKWRSLNVLTFHKIHLDSITREIPGTEKLKLDYNYRTDTWGATRNGVAVNTLDPMSASRLQERLGSLRCSGWYLSIANALKELENPAVTFTIVVRELDPAVGEARPKTYVLKVAPSNIVNPQTSEALYFAILEEPNSIDRGLPDVFILDHSTYGNLRRPVTTSRATN
ncbi:MAG: DUF4340 domain-containing protein [Verrucomicrobiales bacterium]|nr:DUF4340 domain-containing protein [Verrucomicrobiales bacterium]